MRQLGLQSDFQSEDGERLKWLEAAQEREMAKLRELQKQNLAEEARLADTMRDVVGREVSKGGVLLCIVIPSLNVFPFIKHVIRKMTYYSDHLCSFTVG